MSAASRLLGVDFGTVRIGLAISDPDRKIAFPLATYARGSREQDENYFRKLMGAEEIGQLVVGLPVHLNGHEGSKAIEARGFGQWLSALDFYLSHPKEIALLGDLASPLTQALIDVVFKPYLPNRVVMHASGSGYGVALGPLLEDKALVNGQPAAYVCQNYTCRAPVSDPLVLEQQLRE